MNVTLPENKIFSKRQLIIYAVIILICVISIIVAFYVQFYARIDLGKFIGLGKETNIGKKSEEEIQNIKANFDKIFTNSIEENEDNQSKKKDKEKALVYTNYEKKETKLNSYDLEVHIPYINLDNESANKFNEEINQFVKKTQEVLESENKNVIYTVEYVANDYDGILSLMIRSNLKEGTSAQRVIIETFNYDLRNNKEVTLEEALKIKQIEKSDAEKIIKDEIKLEQERAESLKSLGYNIYSRDANSDRYKVENSSVFYITKDTLYVIYPYGNEDLTSEMDLIVF